MLVATRRGTRCLLRNCYDLVPGHFFLRSFTMIANTRLLKAARILLGWSQEELAEKSGLSRPTISKLERGEINVRVHTLLAVQRTLEDGGIDFLTANVPIGEGFRLRSEERRGRKECESMGRCRGG